MNQNLKNPITTPGSYYVLAERQHPSFKDQTQVTATLYDEADNFLEEILVSEDKINGFEELSQKDVVDYFESFLHKRKQLKHEKLIDQIKEKYDFVAEEPTTLKGHSNTIVLENYIFEIEETETIEPLRIELHECHENNKPMENFFRLSIVNCAENDEPHDLFTFTTFDKLDRFISAILQ